MSDSLMLDFPVLKKDCGDFSEEVSYEVEAHRDGENLKITHTVKGQSFISQFVKNSDANFSVLLLYRDCSERHNHLCNTDAISTINDNQVVATQTIPIKFSYAPEVTPSIIVLKDKKISVDASSGLTDFWKQGERLDIPQYSRIALGQKLKFTSGDVSKLMKVEFDDKRGDGEMQVVVRESAGEGETPVSLLCGKDVYYELHKITQKDPTIPAESLRWSIITQALCAVYAYMQNLVRTNEDYKAGGVLAAHLEMLESKTEENWENEEFDPSLAATKMQPYVLKMLDGGDDDD